MWVNDEFIQYMMDAYLCNNVNTWNSSIWTADLNKSSVYDPLSYCYLSSSEKGQRNSVLNYLSSAHNCKDHTLKIGFNLQ